MNLEQITPLILTWNEAPNIGRTLSRLAWAREIVVIDSGSTDNTLATLHADPRVRVHHHPFESFAQQLDVGLAHVHTAWVLSLDADYLVPPELVDEIHALPPEPAVDGYAIPFRYCIGGQPLRLALLPPRIILHRVAGASHVQDGHAGRVRLAGPHAALRTAIWHDDRKPFGRWLRAQRGYAAQEAELISGRRWRELTWPDRIRRMVVIAPWMVPLYLLLLRGGMFDGWRGVRYAGERAIAETMLATRLLFRRTVAPTVSDRAPTVATTPSPDEQASC